MENVGNVHSVSVSALISKQYSTSEPDAFDTPVVSPIQESQVARIPSYDQANIASDVLLAAGRHPTLPHLNSAFAVLKKTLPSIFNSPVDLGTVRWDTLDPVDHSAIGGDEGSMTARTAPRIASHSVSDITAATPDYQQVGAKWRGAQIGSRPTASTGQISQTFSKKFYLALSQPLSHSVAGDRSPLLEKKMEEALAPERHTGSIMDRVAVASEKATPGNIPPPVPSRRLGKRVSEAREVIAKAPKQQERPFSSAGPSGYKIYPCKWSACQAELHNYETLVRHVMYKHKRAANGGTFSCQWDGCLIDSLGDTLSEQIPLQFSDAKEWEQHVMAHMEKVKEQLGLGPTLSETGEPPMYRGRTCLGTDMKRFPTRYRFHV